MDTTTIITIVTDAEDGVGESTKRCGPAPMTSGSRRAIPWASRMHFI
jgi:hypothetical protein